LSIYLDASPLVALFANDTLTTRAEAALRRTGLVLIVSDFAATEFAAAIARRERMKLLTPAEARIAFSAFDTWIARATKQIQLATSDVVAAAAFIRRLDLTLRAPDAIHIAIAQRADADLFTFDTQMAKSARSLGLRLVKA
jgi:predicted nucleic acid-binding protein